MPQQARGNDVACSWTRSSVPGRTRDTWHGRGPLPQPEPVAPEARGDISVVLPTFNRAQALRKNFPSLLALKGVAEIIVVDDGSTDDTPVVLEHWRDERLRMVRRARNAGSPAARNLGAALARGAWVLFCEDDCRFPSNYALVLREEAKGHGAEIVGAPMVHVRPGQSVQSALTAARAERRGPSGLDEVAGFPNAAITTPLLPAPVLINRSVLDELRFDEGYRGNAYREETDFFIRATQRGLTCLLTPRTYFCEEGRWPGGQSRPLALAEYWTMRNNWRFLRRHRCWLTSHAYISSPLAEQLAFVMRRLRRVVSPGQCL